MLSTVRMAMLVVGLLLLGSCSKDEATRVPVAIRSVDVSDDRRTLTVTTAYATSVFCAKQADGVDVEVHGDVAVVSAYVTTQAGTGGNVACTWSAVSLPSASPSTNRLQTALVSNHRLAPSRVAATPSSADPRPR